MDFPWEENHEDGSYGGVLQRSCRCDDPRAQLSLKGDYVEPSFIITILSHIPNTIRIGRAMSHLKWIGCPRWGLSEPMPQPIVQKQGHSRPYDTKCLLDQHVWSHHLSSLPTKWPNYSIFELSHRLSYISSMLYFNSIHWRLSPQEHSRSSERKHLKASTKLSFSTFRVEYQFKKCCVWGRGGAGCANSWVNFITP